MHEVAGNAVGLHEEAEVVTDDGVAHRPYFDSASMPDKQLPAVIEPVVAPSPVSYVALVLRLIE